MNDPSFVGRSEFQPPPHTLADPITGLLPYVAIAEMEKGDPDVFIAAADTVNTKLYGFPQEVTSKGSGAGLTYESARGAAIGEGIERYAFSIIHPEDLIFGSFQSLSEQGFMPISPKRWAIFNASQYAVMPIPSFEKDTQIAWTKAQSLTHQCDCLVPASMAYIPYAPVFPDQGEKVVTYAISTGSACARTRAEAMFKGICELIERDAFMILWRNRLPLPRVIIDPECALFELFHAKFDRPGLQYTLIQTTLDLEMPSFVGVVLDTRSNPPGIMVGGSAHPDPNRAALKTLLELVQGLKWKDFMKEPFAPEPSFKNVRSFDDRAHLYAFNDLREAFGFLMEHPHEIPLSSIQPMDSGNAAADLRIWVDKLASRDLEVLAMDMTPVDAEACGLYVTRILIPGFETMEGDHLLPFLGGHRWREVPVQLGLQPLETSIDSINPYPHPYP